MRSKLQLTLAVGILTLVEHQVWARGPRISPYLGSPLPLLRHKSVQEDIKLSAEQIQKLQVILEREMESLKSWLELDVVERSKKMAEMWKQDEKLMAAILKPEQAKRLYQVGLQHYGGRALEDATVAKELNLTDDQKSKINEILDKVGTQAGELLDMHREAGTRVPNETWTKIGDLVQAASEKILNLLTPDQKTKWKEMTGEPFKGEIRFGPDRR
jgi:hypothetical protein